MYIVFNNKGEGDLFYYAEPLPDEHKDKKYIKIDEGDIPEKEGYVVTAKLVEDKLEWEFVEITPDPTEQKILELEKANQINLMALMELNRKLLEMGGDE